MDFAIEFMHALWKTAGLASVPSAGLNLVQISSIACSLCFLNLVYFLPLSKVRVVQFLHQDVVSGDPHMKRCY